MASLALGVYVTFLAVAFGVRAAVQYRRTGDHGLRALAHERPSEWLASALIVGGAALAGAAPVAELLDGAAPSTWPGASWLAAAGFVLGVVGVMIVVVSQYQMGNSWRVGVDPHERTPLMTGGLFAVVRNPIFSGVLLATAGLVLMVPNLIAAVALVCVSVGLEMQVRWIEEPYLARIHGDSYVSYGRVVGRFVPGVGRLDEQQT